MNELADVKLLFEDGFSSDVRGVGVISASSFLDVGCYLSSFFHLLLPSGGHAWVCCAWAFVSEKSFDVVDEALFAELYFSLFLDFVAICYKFLDFGVLVSLGVPSVGGEVVFFLLFYDLFDLSNFCISSLRSLLCH